MGSATYKLVTNGLTKGWRFVDGHGAYMKLVDLILLDPLHGIGAGSCEVSNTHSMDMLMHGQNAGM